MNNAQGGNINFAHSVLLCLWGDVKLFGERLKTARKAIGLTGKEAANNLGLTYSAYAKYECNQRMPDIKMLKEIADLFLVTTDYLLERTDDPRLVRSSFNMNNQTVEVDHNAVTEDERIFQERVEKAVNKILEQRGYKN